MLAQALAEEPGSPIVKSGVAVALELNVWLDCRYWQVAVMRFHNLCVPSDAKKTHTYQELESANGGHSSKAH